MRSGSPGTRSHRHLSLPHLLRRSLLHRRARGLSSLVALTVLAAVATALLTLYRDLDQKLHHEFRSFGANLTITAPGTAALPPDTLARARAAVGPDARLALLSFAVATTDRNTSVVAVGADFHDLQQLSSWWNLPGWPTSPTSALLGARAAQFIADEHTVTLRFNGAPLTLQGAGRISTGGDEDSRVYLPLSTFTAWTHVEPSLLELQVPGGEPAVNAALLRLRSALPGLRVEPVRQLVAGETRIVDRTHALMLGAVLLIACTVSTSVLASLSASVLERRRDFALMRALGSTPAHLARLFLLEAATLALAAVLLGWLLGSAVAWLVSEINFSTGATPSLLALPAVLLITFAVAALSATLPLQTLRRLHPAAILRGE